MSGTLPRGSTLADLMVLVAATAVGAWCTLLFREEIPMSLIARPGIPLHALFLSIPIAAALTWASLVIPVRGLRTRARRPIRQPDMAASLGAAAVMLGVAVRWTLRAWPYVHASAFTHGTLILYDWGTSCGLGVTTALSVQVACRRLRPRPDGFEGLRWLLAGYWVTLFLILDPR